MLQDGTAQSDFSLEVSLQGIGGDLRTAVVVAFRRKLLPRLPGLRWLPAAALISFTTAKETARRNLRISWIARVAALLGAKPPCTHLPLASASATDQQIEQRRLRSLFVNTVHQ
jgi:hypothetical protein